MTTLKLGVLPHLPRARAYSGTTTCSRIVPLVGWVHMTRLSLVIWRPHVLPPLEEYCSMAEPSGLKRTTPLPMLGCFSPLAFTTLPEPE